MSASNEDVIKFIAAIALLFGGVGVIGWQVYEYLRHNIWTPISIVTALEWMQVKWAMNPSDWTGLYSLLMKIPLSATMIVAGWTVVISENS